MNQERKSWLNTNAGATCTASSSQSICHRM